MKQIYILEDNKDIGYILELLLVNEGYGVEVLENVETIKAKMDEQLPDLFLLDIIFRMATDWHFARRSNWKRLRSISL